MSGRPPEWGRLRRGRRWHLLTGTDEPWCDSDLGTAWEVTEGLPPRGGIPCPRCCHQVAQLAAAVQAAVAAGRDVDEDDELPRPRAVETVDLVGALAAAQNGTAP